MWRYCTDRIALQHCRAQEFRPFLQGRDAQRMEIALGASSFVMWTEEFMVVFRDCRDHMDYMPWVDKGATSCFAQMPAYLRTLPSRSVQLRSWLGQPVGPGM